MKAIIRTKGGPTSGNWGHMGRPGKVGGSGKGGGFGRLSGFRPDLTPDELRQAAAEQSAELKRKKKDAKLLLKDMKKILGGYDTDSIVFAGPGYEFEVGKDQYVAAGDYDPSTGIIRLFDGAFGKDMISIYPGIVAHEIEHDKYNKWFNKYWEQSSQISNRQIEEVGAGIDWRDSFMRADGNFKTSEDKEKYSAYTLYYDYFTGPKRDDLMKKDGITSYSESYWNKFQSTHQTHDMMSAINETLAEVARLRLESSANKFKAIDPLWIELYDAINAEALK